MSHVTSILLIVLDEPKAIEKVNKWLSELGKGELLKISDHAGGTKVMFDTYAGGYNYIPVDDFLNMMDNIKFQDPDCVVMVIEDEHWDTPCVYKFNDDGYYVL